MLKDVKNVNVRLGHQSLVRLSSTANFSFSKNVDWSSQDWMQSLTSQGVCNVFQRNKYLDNRPKYWSISSWLCPLRKHERLALLTLLEDTSEARKRNIIEFLHSLQVLSDWIVICIPGRCAPCFCKRVRTWLSSSMLQFESLGVSGGVIMKVMHHP